MTGSGKEVDSACMGSRHINTFRFLSCILHRGQERRGAGGNIVSFEIVIVARKNGNFSRKYPKLVQTCQFNILHQLKM